jgi:hypothetical protein
VTAKTVQRTRGHEMGIGLRAAFGVMFLSVLVFFAALLFWFGARMTPALLVVAVLALGWWLCQE